MRSSTLRLRTPFLGLAAATLFLAIPVVSFAQEAAPVGQDPSTQGDSSNAKKNYGLGLGLGGGVYFPTYSTIKNIFGKSIFKLGADFGAPPQVGKGKFGVGFGLISATGKGDSFYVGQLMATYTAALGPTDDHIKPYYKIGVGMAYADYVLDTSSGHHSAKCGLPTAQAELGVILYKNLHVSLAYDVFSSVSGVNFNGFNIQATYTVLRF